MEDKARSSIIKELWKFSSKVLVKHFHMTVGRAVMTTAKVITFLLLLGELSSIILIIIGFIKDNGSFLLFGFGLLACSLLFAEGFFSKETTDGK